MNSIASQRFVAWLTLLSGLAISAVAVYYSVIGLTAIFAAATIPIIIMGVTLEVSKLVATVWLKQNWNQAPLSIKSYLMAAILVLMLVTSMGIFGFLSRAHLDQTVPSADVAAKLAIFDEQIRTERENQEAARRALAQMDLQVDQLVERSRDSGGAERAAQLRRTQTRERAALQRDIAQAQEKIRSLQQQRAPIASELRKVDAEVGPIKYLAAFFYNSQDQVVLERAVTWVILIIIVVFDPLALVLLLASQTSFQNIRTQLLDTPPKALPVTEPYSTPDDTPDVFEPEPAKEEQQIQPPQPIEQREETLKFVTKVFPRVEGYVQNEEQKESNLWSSTVGVPISPEEYQKKSQEFQAQAQEFADAVRTQLLSLEDVPAEFRSTVEEKLKNAR